MLLHPGKKSFPAGFFTKLLCVWSLHTCLPTLNNRMESGTIGVTFTWTTVPLGASAPIMQKNDVAAFSYSSPFSSRSELWSRKHVIANTYQGFHNTLTFSWSVSPSSLKWSFVSIFLWKFTLWIWGIGKIDDVISNILFVKINLFLFLSNTHSVFFPSLYTTRTLLRLYIAESFNSRYC